MFLKNYRNINLKYESRTFGNGQHHKRPRLLQHGRVPGQENGPQGKFTLAFE